jgi:hypothetical protein
LLQLELGEILIDDHGRLASPGHGTAVQRSHFVGQGTETVGDQSRLGDPEGNQTTADIRLPPVFMIVITVPDYLLPKNRFMTGFSDPKLQDILGRNFHKLSRAEITALSGFTFNHNQFPDTGNLKPLSGISGRNSSQFVKPSVGGCFADLKFLSKMRYQFFFSHWTFCHGLFPPKFGL